MAGCPTSGFLDHLDELDPAVERTLLGAAGAYRAGDRLRIEFDLQVQVGRSWIHALKCPSEFLSSPQGTTPELAVARRRT